MAAVAALLLAGCRAAPSTAGREWTILFHMSYDNDLARHYQWVLEAIGRGVVSERVGVAVLADGPERDDLRWISISPGRTEVFVPSPFSDDSASADGMGLFIEWARRKLPAPRNAYVFIDHGNGPGELCLDEHRGPGRRRGFLGAAEAGGELRRRFSGRGKPSLDLLYLQLCGKASVDDLCAFTNAARHVLASPMPIGAPNTYYEPTLKWLAEHPGEDGAALGRRIMADDRHYNILALFDGAALAELPARFRRAADTLPDDVRSSRPSGLVACHEVDGWYFHDVVQWLDRGLRIHGGDRGGIADFKDWMANRLVIAKTVTPGQPPAVHALCGLSFCLPREDRRDVVKSSGSQPR